MAQATVSRTRLGDIQTVQLPTAMILEERATPVLSFSGKTGFIASVTTGSLISFSLRSGKILATAPVGQSAGAVSMLETPEHRLIAVPAANDPERGRPATVNIIDATDVKSFDTVAFITLPPTAHLTPTTRVLLASNAIHGVVASSFDEPTVYSFSMDTGQVVSERMVIGRPSELALHDPGEGGGGRLIAVTSAAANLVTILRMGDGGELDVLSTFTPGEAGIEESNNPVFSADGRVLYLAAARADRLYAFDVKSGREISSVEISPAPQRISVAVNPSGGETVAVVRTQRADSGSLGGVTLVNSRAGRLAIKTEFTPPEQVQFSRANNPVILPQLSVAFVASSSGILFAFSSETGELQSHQMIGSELLGITLHAKSKTAAVVRRGPRGDEIIVVPFEVASEAGEPDSPPVIQVIKPNLTEQGRKRDLPLIVRGQNFGTNSTVLVNDTQIPATVERGQKTLSATLPASLFAQAGRLTVKVKVGDLVSNAMFLEVRNTEGPVINRLSPEGSPGPTGRIPIRVIGKNFKPTSLITAKIGSAELQQLVTEFVGSTELRAVLPKSFARAVGTILIQVKSPDAVSNEKEFIVFGPRIDGLETSGGDAVAGAGSFRLWISGANFRDGAQVELDGSAVPVERTRQLSKTLIRVNMKERDVQTSGKIRVVVRNPEGNASDPRELVVNAPRITSINPSPVLAGTTDALLDIHGSFFRKHSVVTLVNSSGQSVELGRAQVRFRSSQRVTVALKRNLNTLIAQKGELLVRVVNPNLTTGVPSEAFKIAVAAPEIVDATMEPDGTDASLRRLVIKGTNFRNRAEVELLRAGMALQRITPEVSDEEAHRRQPTRAGSGKLVVLITAAKLERWGPDLEVKVVNPGEVKSNKVKLRQVDSTP